MTKKTRVIIVDDSQVMRDLIAQIVRSQPDMEVAATAQDPFDAREKIKALSPDVVLLDIEMPRMDGLTFLDKIMRLRPMPVVMVSTLTVAGGTATLRALELGAVDFVTKPASRLSAGMVDVFAADIAAKVRIAAVSAQSVMRRGRILAPAATPSVKPSSPMTGNAGTAGSLGVVAHNAVVAIGASTGGIEGDVDLPLDAAFRIPLRLAMADETKAGSGGFRDFHHLRGFSLGVNWSDSTSGRTEGAPKSRQEVLLQA